MEPEGRGVCFQKCLEAGECRRSQEAKMVAEAVLGVAGPEEEEAVEEAVVGSLGSQLAVQE